MDSPDIAYQVLPWLRFQAHEWAAGRFPLWEANQMGGQPLLGQMQPGVLNPFYWVLFCFSRWFEGGELSITGMNWLKLGIHWVATYGTYLLCRDMKLSRWAAVLGGCVFGLGGFMAGVGWPQMMCSAAWLPLVMLFTRRAMIGRQPLRDAGLAGLFLALQFLGGHHNVPIFTALTVAIGWFVWLVANREALTWRKCAAPFVFVGIAVGFAAPQLLPARETGKVSLRWVSAADPVGWDDRVPYAVHETFSTKPAELPAIVLPQLAEGSSLFLGITGLALALLAGFRCWKTMEVRWLAAMAVGALLFAMGGSTALHGLLYQFLPELHKSRSPSMALAIFSLAAAVLAAYGADEYLRAGLRGTWLAVVGLVLFAGVAALKVWPSPYEHLRAEFSLTAMACLLLAAFGQAQRHKAMPPLLLQGLVLGLSLLELNWSSNYRLRPWGLPDSPMAHTHWHTDVAEFLKAQPEPVRIATGDDIPYNFGDWYGVSHINGYLASLTRNVVSKFYQPQMQRILGVNFLLAAKPPVGATDRFAARIPPIRVYDVPESLPNFRTVHQVRQVPNEGESDRLVNLKEIDIAQEATLLLPPPPVAQCAEPDTIRVLSNHPTRAVVAVKMGCAGMLLQGEVWTREWRGTVDDKPAELFAAYELVRGVFVPQGEHVVVFDYWPRSLRRGLWLALAAAVLLAGLCWDGRKRQATLR